MTERIPCTRCGAMILPATAQRNQGLCAPCKMGRREAIEIGKNVAAADKLRAREPNYWVPLVKQAEASGFDSLNEPQKLCYAVWLLELEVCNGGLDQFYSNSSGNYFADAERGLEILGLLGCLKILRESSKTVFADAAVPADRWKRVEAVSALNGDPLGPLGTRFVQAAEQEQLHERVTAFAIRNALAYTITG